MVVGLWFSITHEKDNKERAMPRKAAVVQMPQAEKKMDTKLEAVATKGKRVVKGSAQDVVIPDLKLGMIKITVKGLSNLIVHQFGDKTKRMISDKQQGQAAHKKGPKNPVDDWKDSLYEVPGRPGVYGFPASGFKKAAVSACKYVDGMNMSYAKGAFHILGDILPIKTAKTPKPVIGEGMREDFVRLPGPRPVADVRYRAEFKDWSIELPVQYNSAVITPAQIANLLNIAGFSVGVGDWRPEKGGSFGMFTVASHG